MKIVYVVAALVLCSFCPPAWATPTPPSCATPELAMTDVSDVVLTPQSYTTWTAMLAANPNALDYLIQPGDYMSWGLLTLQNKDGAANRKRTIRYYDPSAPKAHPAQRVKEALVDGIKVFNSDNWIVSGLTQRSTTSANDISQGSTNVVFDSMLIEEPKFYGIRLRTTGTTCVTKSVIRRSSKVPGQDAVGVQIQPIAGPIASVSVIDNEIYDVVDSVQVTDNATNAWVAVAARIEGNDLYTTPSYAGCTENAIDLKAGSDTGKTIIKNNRMWGFVGATGGCGGSGSRGDVIVVQRASRNVEITDNQIFASRNGVVVAYWPSDWPNQFAPRYVTQARNYFFNNESAVDIMMDSSITGNTFATSPYLCDTGGASGYRAGGPVFKDNTLIDIGAITMPGDTHPCPYVPEQNQVRPLIGPSQYVPRPWETN